jgi:hypothetical protein
MADVEMSDAPVAAKKADGVSGKGGEKKKFEVKKVRCVAVAVPNKSWIQQILTGMGSGTPLRFGLGILSSTTAPSAETTSWTSVSRCSSPCAVWMSF